LLLTTRSSIGDLVRRARVAEFDSSQNLLLTIRQTLYWTFQ
jgi:hypothetical protein